MPTSRYDVIIMAGYDRIPTPLSEVTGQPCKALIPIAGRPMVHYLIHALQASNCMARLAIVGIGTDELAADAATVFVPNQGSLVANLATALQSLESSAPVLVASADIPLLTPQAVRDLVARCEEAPLDLGYPIVERQVMEARYPGSGRTFVPLVEGDFAGGDIFYLRPRVFRNNAALFASLSMRRKSAWKLAQLMGAGIPLRYALKRLRIRDLEGRAQRLLGANCRAIVSTYPELAMDVDKPHHLELVRHVLTSQS